MSLNLSLKPAKKKKKKGSKQHVRCSEHDIFLSTLTHWICKSGSVQAELYE